ncbi:hypothetical protein BJV77DRAFT_993083 [Russula vinacea]|nr:hypothetical protein BJV77DRAFT_993083 [Russula vinacea]
MARVVDSDGMWSGEVDVLGDDTIKLFGWMEDLRSQAQRAGGQMLSHLGNHEWMNAIGQYVYESEIKTFGGIAARQAMVSTGRIGRAWAANYTTASRLPLHPVLGAPNEDFPPHAGSLQLRVQPPPHPPHPYPGLPSRATPEEHTFYGSDGPLWYRKVCREVDSVLEKTGTRRMIMGHTPDFEEIVSRCNGKIIIIDTGISHAYGGALSALSVEYILEDVRSSSSSEKNKLREKEVVKAVYVNRTVVLVDEDEISSAYLDSPVGFFPGGPSPDSAFPSHNKPINTRLQAAAAAVDTETHYQGGEMTSQRQEPAGPQPIHELTSDLLPQPSEHHLASPSRSYGQPLSDEHPEIAPAVRVAAPNGGAAEGWDPRRSTSLTTRRTNRSLRTTRWARVRPRQVLPLQRTNFPM